MGLFKGPIEKQVRVKGEFDRPIAVGDVQDLLDAGFAPYRKSEPALATAVQNAATDAAVLIIQENGSFTLKGLEKWNDQLQLAGSGVAKLVSRQARDGDTQARIERMVQGLAMLAKFAVAWVNEGRPELALDDKVQLDLDKLRAAVSQRVQPEDRQYISALLDALEAEQPGRTIALRDLDAIQKAIEEKTKPLADRISTLEGARLQVDQGLRDQKHALVLQSLGAFRLEDFLKAVIDLGELQTLAASVKPGAEAVLGGAAG